ncbi:MAG: hypothetical protein ACYTGZ_10400 [Planctomycetota bacterium]|jgi:hypothetical protein
MNIRTFALTLVLLLCVPACYRDRSDPDVPVAAQAWPEADALFRSDLRWLGGGTPTSVDLGADRTLWLFGMSYIDPAGSGDRKNATLVNNSIAIQTGRDPVLSTIEFFWGDGPASFFPGDDDTWLWPQHGIRDGGALTLFFTRYRPGGLFGEPIETVALRIDNPDDEPDRWVIRELDMFRSPVSPVLATSVTRQGDHVHAYAVGTGKKPSAFLLRWSLADFAVGTLTDPQWWGGARGWVRSDEVPARVLGDSASQFAVAPDGDRFVVVQSRGYAGDFDADEIGVRISSQLEGPFPAVSTVFRPAEARSSGVLASSARSHAHLEGADLVATYVPTTPDPVRAAADTDLEYPRFLRLTYTDR